MRGAARRSTVVVVGMALGFVVAQTRALHAQPNASKDHPPPAETEVEGDDAPAPADDNVQQRMAALEQRLGELQGVLSGRRPIVSLGGYVDFGFFATSGDGAVFVQDLGPNRRFPDETNRFAWVFLGDLLAPAVNSRGEPADLGNPPGVNRYDSIHSRGAPGFIVNEVNLTLNATLADNALATASVDFMPRTGADFHMGDAFEVDIAQLEWMLGLARRTSVFVGKIASVLGIEYRERKANQRFGITPSLIARYTVGTPLGIKVRSKIGDGDWLVVAAAITNGSSTIEMFHFYDETDSNAGKTVSGRIAIAPGRRVELGVSGAYGAQDHALGSGNALWFLGADLQGHFGPLELKAEWLTARGPGETQALSDPANRPYGLRLNVGAYLEADVMVTAKLGFLARGEVRDARVWLGNPDGPMGGERLYITKNWRATVGARFVANEHVIVKAEYLHNGEYGGIPQIRDDVVTSSLILAF